MEHPSHRSAGSSYPTALAATAQSIADYATACGSDPRGGIERAVNEAKRIIVEDYDLDP